MRENCTSGLMSGEGKRSAHKVATAPLLDSTEPREDGRCRCGSGLRGGGATDNAVRARQVTPVAGGTVDAPDARSAGQAAYAVDQHDPRSTRRVWGRHPQRPRTSASDGATDRRW